MGVKGDPEGDVKPDVDSKKHTLTIRLGQHEDELTIKVKGSTKFAKIYQAVASQTGKAEDSFRLQFDGELLQKHKSPSDYDFEEEEIIDLQLEQVGGGGAFSAQL
ncbi:hypothetical protein JCM10908_001465 [Rhodotorula pacifica]|uniref:uncharacterized protein n=1 Tax=Rhodotorula pacifica TaxID=1495444 RepID=UPI00317C3AD1